MADNPALPLASGSAIAADDIAGVLWPFVKLAFGVPDSATPVSSTNPLPVTTDGSPARNAFTITPHATNAVNPLPRAVRFNAAGTVAFRAADATADVAITVVAGEVVPIRMAYIRATGTTVSAADIHGLA